ncbi:histidine kinase/DNA gyrase B/HSP90-like ATPase [Gelidibacter algens]|uniref:Histidine kinase/DNA gyrase B/HSP90-like ATPase n=1 Tax=Gelidibacter algens TaxID=49280 RepID=A0A327RQM3_9FLAO|nr:HAMP domain-containing sensor histidine kinase [Gelidibacter algens]RAJ19189.1 histidine kinase/DNA gyrase B/HSP90-like ATPase [Gelidibacter algens]
MSKLSFKVSARTARLIGRENIANSKGAIIELVKNGYDADSDISIVYFDNEYSPIINEISLDYYNTLLQKGINKTLLNNVYDSKTGKFIIKEGLEQEPRNLLKKSLNKLNSLYIIDSGEGMTQNIIRDYWMTIGTDHKAIDVFTNSGKVKSGAKGIGRFALDRLGGKCEMITVYNPENHKPDTDELGNPSNFSGYNWKVNWEDFEGDFKTIDTVKAELIGIESKTIKKEIIKEIPELNLGELNTKVDFEFGTILKITDLRDNWEDYYVEQVYSDLEVLVPPKESGEFQIFLFSTLSPEKYGEVVGSVCDDFDYKLIASANDKQMVTLKIIRDEYDLDRIDPDFFKRNEMQNKPYTKADFEKGYWEKKMTFSQLLPGFSEKDEEKVFDNIGVFNFTFYYMKKGYSSEDIERFYYNSFMTNNRRAWLEKFAGVKLFRDNFRVRPYGEVQNTSFDWLDLGLRKSQNQAGIAKEEGGWRVEPENVSGAIKISRLTNVDFEDKSSREGLQENKTFQIFKKLLANIILVLEEDRAYIARAMDAFYKENNSDAIDRKKAEALAKSILEKEKGKREKQKKEGKKSSQNQNDNQLNDSLSNESIVLAELNREKDEEIEKLKDEQKVLRGLASSGIVLASFSHDLSKLNDVLDSRVEKLKQIIATKFNEKDYEDTEDRKNPFARLEKMKKQDLKLQNWLKFSLGATRKDKRKRPQVFLHKYFKDLKDDWQIILENRAIDFDVSSIEEIELRVFEIEFDSIFNNLLVNSFDAFKNSKENRSRKIIILAKATEKEIVIEYYDNGPGLSKDIENPEKIFEPLFTTRRNAFTGEEEGTGLGMWLIGYFGSICASDFGFIVPGISVQTVPLLPVW